MHCTCTGKPSSRFLGTYLTVSGKRTIYKPRFFSLLTEVHARYRNLMSSNPTSAAYQAYHTHTCAGQPLGSDLQVSANEKFPGLCNTCICVYALASHRFCQRNRSSKVVGCAHTLMRAGDSIPAHSTTLSLQLLSVVLGARPRCPDLQQHTFVRALDKPSSQVLGTDLTVSGKETNRLVLTKPTKPSFSCYKTD